MKTIIHRYYFDVSKQEQATAYNALCDSLRAKGLKVFAVWTDPSSKTHRDFEKAIKALDGLAVELDEKWLFNNQWNTAPIEGVSENGLRLMDWHEYLFPNDDIKSGYWLEQTPDMIEARRNRAACGYCGKQEPMQKGYVFCPHCLDSEYLKPEDLHLTRMQSVADKRDRAPLSEAEKAHLMPLYVHAQTKAVGSRAKAKADKQRRDIIAKAEKAIDNATIEREGFLWLLDNGVNIDNCIYYARTGKFSFGWRSPVSPDVRDAILEIISEFPFPYEIKCDDGRTLEGY